MRQRTPGLGGLVRPETAWLGALLLVTVVPFAILRPITNDEIYTLKVATQPSLISIWAALRIGADNHPPLDYWLRHVALATFGEHALALRLPSILAIWVAGVLAVRCQSSWLGRPLAFSSAVVILIAVGYQVSLETRGYALLVAWCLWSLTSWQQLIDRPTALWPQLSFGSALAGAVYSHYYGVLHLVAFVGATLTLSFARGRLLVRPLVLIGLAAVLCTPLFPLIAVAARFRSGFWTPVTVTAALNFYPLLLSSMTPLLVASAVVLLLLPRRDTARPVGESPLPVATAHALAWFALLPVAAWILAKIMTGAFLPRYVPSAAVAIAMGGLALARDTIRMRASGRSAVLVVALPIVFLCVPVEREIAALVTYRSRPQFTSALMALQARVAMPVVIGDDGLFVEMSYSQQSTGLGNCYVLYDPFPARRTNVDLALAGLVKVWPIRAVPFDEMRASHEQFAFIGTWGDRVLERALADGAHIEFTADGPTGLRYWVVQFRGATRPQRDLRHAA